jgi:hypothetical protein
VKRNLSSELTGFFKLFPAVWIILFGLATAGLFGGVFQGKDGLPAPQSFKLLFLSLWVVGSVLAYAACASLKEVAIDENNLYVSNYINEISIPLTDVSDITENIWWNFHPITVHLKRRSEFGEKIIFMPKRAMLSFGGSHPIVDQLKSRAKLEGT